jgi:WD40 repeat protein
MAIFGFENGREKIYQTFNVQRQVFKIIEAKHDLILMCFLSGDSELMCWNNEENKLIKIKSEKTEEHDESLTCCDTLISKGILITGDKVGNVKIWNSMKQLIREIKFVEPINSVCFLNTAADIIVGHSGNLSLVQAKDYLD